MNSEKNVYRIKFEKTGAMKFIGHLDLLKIFQRTVKRSALPVAYSQGFNPHQIMSFALPLSVGVESIGELVEIEFTESLDCTDAAEKLNAAMPGGLKIIHMRKLAAGEKNAAASLCSASYELLFPKTIQDDKLCEAISEILAKNEIIITKKSKKGDRQVDIRAMIFELESLKGHLIHAKLATGSTTNLKAEVIAEIICEKLEAPYSFGDVRIRRLALFGANENVL